VCCWILDRDVSVVTDSQSMLQEFKQLNAGAVPGKPVFGTVDPTTLNREEKRRENSRNTDERSIARGN
jgi:hypothetical protein